MGHARIARKLNVDSFNGLTRMMMEEEVDMDLVRQGEVVVAEEGEEGIMVVRPLEVHHDKSFRRSGVRLI